MIRKSGPRFPEKIMLTPNIGVMANQGDAITL